MVDMEKTEIVISGIGGAFPKSNNIEEFQQMLFDHEDMVQNEMSESVLDSNEKYGTIPGYNDFDATFFGMHRSLATYLSPLYRKTLESTFEAIIDAGISLSDIRGRKIGVIICITFNQDENIMYANIGRGAGVISQARTMIANRISYWIHAVGPSYTIANNWIAGMTAMEAAYDLIKRGECEGVLIGGSNTTGNDHIRKVFRDIGVTSTDGKTCSFDENAAGCARSDGVVMMFLQRADLARRHYATVVNVESMFNGYKCESITTMSVDSARNFLTNFYQRAKVDPGTVQYIETYGTAVQCLDNFEINLIDNVFNNFSRTQPLLIGSVKSNMGHGEVISVFASVIKTIIAMEKREIPANLNYKGNNKIPAIRDAKIKVVTENTPWSGTLAAVNGYGLVSSCGHILLKSIDKESNKNDNINQKLPQLYLFSTRTEEGVQQIIEKIKSYDHLSWDYLNLVNNVFLHNISGHLYRGCLLRDQTKTIADEFANYTGESKPIWFVYSGMGSQWITMGKDLMRLPIFAAAVHKCHAILEPHGVDLIKIICSKEDPDVFNKILHSFVGIAAVQIGLTDILHALGIRPDNLIGHSVGELGCAYADGGLTAEQMILAAYYRGRASQEAELIPGLMAAIGMGAKKVAPMLPPSIDIACRNGPESCTLSGPAEDMHELVHRLQGSNIFARTVNVAGIAYHSRYIKPAAPLLLNYCKKIIPEPKLRSAKWLSSSVPEANGGWNTERAKYLSAEYLTNNLLSCVHFEDLLKYIPSNAIVIEIAPHGLLQAILKRSIPTTCINVALTKRDEINGTDFLLKNIGKLYLAGTQLHISKLYDLDIDKIQSTTIMPCARGTPSLVPLTHWNYTEKYINDFHDDDLADDLNEKTYALSTNAKYLSHLKGHRIFDIDENTTKNGTMIVPLTTYMSIVTSQNIRNTSIKPGNVVFENVQLYRHRLVPDDQIKKYIPPFAVITQPATHAFEVIDRYGTIAAGHCVSLIEPSITTNDKIMKRNFGQKTDELTREDIYREFTNRGQNFQNDYQSINKLEIYENGMIANVTWTKEWHTFASNMLQMAIFRYGQPLQCPVDTVFIRSFKYLLNEENTPEEGSTLEVIFNYTTDIISSSIITIDGVRCQPIKVKSNVLVTDKCYSVSSQNNFAACKTVENITVINIKETEVNKLVLNSELSWVKELKQTLSDDSSDNVYLIMKVIPDNGIDSFFANVQLLPNGKRVRLIITLDPEAPEFNSITDPFYQPAFKQQESNVSVYCKGVWEYRYTISSKLNDPNTDKECLTSLITEQDISQYLPDVKVRFVGINTVSLVPTLSNKMSIENQLGVIDYAGTENKTNNPVMGLATINNKNDLSSDAIFRWQMPKHWSLADGATVPFAYCIAYYAICECAALRPGQSILIHNGCSSIGQAMIRVAISLGGVIYTTVGSQKQRMRLYKSMKIIEEEVIFDYTSNSFEIQIMDVTRGAGVDVLVNCLPEDSLRAGLRCVSTSGRAILLLDETRLEEQYQEYIGLSAFLNCFGMYGIRATKIFNLPEDTKKNLHNYVMKGLKEKIVIPINKNIFQENGRFQLDNIVKYLTGPSVTGSAVVPIEALVNNKHFKTYTNQISKKDSTYIVYGGEDVDNIITLTHWLATTHGAKNITILSSHSRNMKDKKILDRDLKNITTEQKSVNIKLLEVAVNKPDLALQQIIQQKITNIAAVLILSNGNNQNDELLINKLQSKFPTTHIVSMSCIANANLVDLERYHTKNIKNVSFLRWDKTLRLVSILKSLKGALEEVVDIFVRNNMTGANKDTETIFTYQDFCSLLSSSVSSLLRYSPVKSSVSVEPMASKNPRKTIDLTPVFIVPGLMGNKCTYLQSTVRNLLNPVYILDASYGTLTLEQLAVRLGEHIWKIYANGPYNIIGVSTGGPLAIELVKHLEADLGATAQLYLLDGVPNTLKQLLSPNDDKTIVEVNLLKELLNIDDTKLLASLSTLPNWNARVDAVLQHQSGNTSKQMRKILQAFKQRIDAVLKYEPSKRTFNGKTQVIIPEETIISDSLVMEDLTHITSKIIKGNHFTMLQELSLQEYLNENLIHPTFYNC